MKSKFCQCEIQYSFKGKCISVYAWAHFVHSKVTRSLMNIYGTLMQWCISISKHYLIGHYLQFSLAHSEVMLCHFPGTRSVCSSCIQGHVCVCHCRINTHMGKQTHRHIIYLKGPCCYAHVLYVLLWSVTYFTHDHSLRWTCFWILTVCQTYKFQFGQ